MFETIKLMNNFWDERYSAVEYAYGENPNEFYRQELLKLKPGKILFPAEGEGRNAVYAARLGWKVTAFDTSIEGRKKAIELTIKHNVRINYLIEGYETIDLPKESFDCIVFVYAHIHSSFRNEYHRKLASFLKPGGILIMESFSKEQLFKESGGPKNIEMLYSVEDLKTDFSDFSELQVVKTETELSEGDFHRGSASVIRVLGTK